MDLDFISPRDATVILPTIVRGEQIGVYHLLFANDLIQWRCRDFGALHCNQLSCATRPNMRYTLLDVATRNAQRLTNLAERSATVPQT